MGSKFTKWKKKTVESKNNLRNADSTQSLNTPEHDSVSVNPGLSSTRNANSTQSLNIHVCSANPAPNASSQHGVTQTLTQAQSAVSPIAPGRRYKTQQAQTIAVSVQTEKNECVPDSQRKPNTGSYFCHNEARNEDDLSSIKGDLMQVIHDEDSDGCNVAKNEEGRVPTNCVKQITSVDVKSQTYSFQLNKKEAEEKLLEPEIEMGTYLLRRSRGAYVLSLRCQNEIEHYKIRVDDNGVCYIDDSNVKIKPFSNITELIKYYTEEPGLSCKLKTPLPRDTLQDDLAVKFSDSTLKKKKGSRNFGFVYSGLNKRKDKKNAAKLKKLAGKETLRNADATQSLNNLFNVSLSINPDPSGHRQPEDMHTLPRTQSEGACNVERTSQPNTGYNPKANATMNFEAKNKVHLSLTKRDIIQLINDELTDEQISQWHARSLNSASDRSISSPSVVSGKASTGPPVDDHDTDSDGCNVAKNEEGRVPTNCVEQITSVDVESQKFFYQLNKKEAEGKLLEPEIEMGTYLLRRSRDTGAYALSLRCENEINELDIKHYKIRVDDNGVCYIDDNSNVKIKPFSSIMELIKYYTEEPGLQCRLITPLPHDTALDDLGVKFSDLQLGEKLGSGNFGSVYAGTLHSNKQVAVKSLKTGGSMTVEQFRKEAETMHKLRHPNLVTLLAICEGNDKIYIITERMSKGSLLTLLREDTDHTITFKDLMHMAIQVVDGMCYLEKKAFVHRDLRAANVLVGYGNITKIADFGLARLLDSYYGHEHFYQMKNGTVFPYKWTAPEAIKQQKFTVKSDVWSFGILLYEMVTYGDEPYAAMSNNLVLHWVVEGNRLKRPTEHHCPVTLYNIMRQCWSKNSEDRPNFADIKETLIEIKTNA